MLWTPVRCLRYSLSSWGQFSLTEYKQVKIYQIRMMIALNSNVDDGGEKN